ncbi:hypothetical protein D3C76_755590 [compost metagenome]
MPAVGEIILTAIGQAWPHVMQQQVGVRRNVLLCQRRIERVLAGDQRGAMAGGAADGRKQLFALHDCWLGLLSTGRCRQVSEVEVQVAELQGVQLGVAALRRVGASLLSGRAVLLRGQRRGDAKVAKHGVGDLLAQVWLVGLEAKPAGLGALSLDAPHRVDVPRHAVGFGLRGHGTQGALVNGLQQTQAEYRRAHPCRGQHRIHRPIGQLAQLDLGLAQHHGFAVAQLHRMFLPVDMGAPFTRHAWHTQFVELVTIDRVRLWPTLGIVPGQRQAQQHAAHRLALRRRLAAPILGVAGDARNPVVQRPKAIHCFVSGRCNHPGLTEQAAPAEEAFQLAFVQPGEWLSKGFTVGRRVRGIGAGEQARQQTDR